MNPPRLLLSAGALPMSLLAAAPAAVCLNILRDIADDAAGVPFGANGDPVVRPLRLCGL